LVTERPLIDDGASVPRSRRHNRQMPENVCCPNCWAWTELGKRTTCQRCGTALILPDGRNLVAARSNPPPPPPPPPGFANIGATPVRSGGFAALQQSITTAGTNWIGVCRWITIGYGVLTALFLIGIGLLVQHINVPIFDANTGITTVQSFNIGGAFAVAAVAAALFTALLVWLTQFTAARVVFLLLDVLAILDGLAGLGGTARAGSAGLLGVLNLVVDLVYGGALTMSLLRPRPQPAYI
jgi:hypothetical protein